MDPLEKCRICPRSCAVDRVKGELGYCKAGPRIRIARYSLHYWEEPPISGTCGSGTIFFTNCSLRCIYCQNAAIIEGDKGKEYSEDDLVSVFYELKRQRALNINLVTPTHFSPMIRKSIALAKEDGFDLPFIYNTGGYELPSEIEKNDSLVDVYLTDFKYGLENVAEMYSKAKAYPDICLRAIDKMLEQVGPAHYDDYLDNNRLVKGVIVRHLLLPGQLENSKRALELLSKEFGDNILLSIMNQYTPLLAIYANRGNMQALDALSRFPELGNKADSKDYEVLLDYADELGFDDYFWQIGDSAKESFIPEF